MANIGDILSILNQGLALTEQKAQQLQQASRPMSNKVVERARQVLGQFITPMGEQSPMPQPAPQMGITGFASGGKVTLDKLFPAIMANDGGNSLYQLFQGEPLSGSNTEKMQAYYDKLKGFGVDYSTLTGSNYGNYVQGDQYMGGPGGKSMAKLDLLSKLLGGGAVNFGGNGQSEVDPNDPNIPRDAYGRPLSSLKDGERTALAYNRDPFTYGYGPEFNFMYTGGAGAFNPQVSNPQYAPTGYAYNPIADYYSVYGYADGGPVRDFMEDYTPAPNLADLQKSFVEAVNAKDFTTAEQLEELIQNRQMMEGIDTKQSMPTNGGYAKGGKVACYEDGGKVKGKGDGTSDSINAKLSVDEYVIPAWAVSQIGKGSSDAGHAFFDNLLANLKKA